MEPNHRSPPRATWIVLLVLALPFALLVARFDWLCDDSFISFRYARNLAEGHGLVYNPGESPRVEGFTNLLWVLFLAPFEHFDARVPLVARIASASCGGVLFFALGWLVAARARDWRAVTCAMLFPATLPPLAAWATSGLETMPFTLAVFATFAALFADRPRAWLAGVSAVAALLLRADGFVFAGMVLTAALATAWLSHSRERMRAALIASALTALAFAAHMLWRHAYYDAWAPNTARVKIELGSASLSSGASYVATFLLSYPATLIAAAVALLVLRRSRDATAAAALAVAGGIFAYALVVGGDFMAMGRFLVPAMPLLAVAFASALAHWLASSRAGSLGAPAAAGACAVLSLLAAFDIDVAPASLRRHFRFRWNTEDWLSEYGQWEMMQKQAVRWRVLGLALHASTEPGESLVCGTIGAIGYYSRLDILDPYGLVSRDPFEAQPPSSQRSPGHQRRIALSTFLAHAPTYLEAQIVRRDDLFMGLRDELAEGGAYADVAVPEWVEIQDVPGAPPSYVLRRVRYRPRAKGG